MGITNETTRETYSGDGFNQTFAIPFEYISGEVDVIKVILIESDGTEVPQVITTNFTLDDPTDPANVLMNVAPAADEDLRVERESPNVQETDLQENSVYNPLAITAQFDRNVLQIQESVTRIEDLEAASPDPVAASSTASILDWATLTDYTVGQTVRYEDPITSIVKFYRCLIAHTSGNFSTDYGLGKWEIALEGIAGDQGVKGDTGAAGGTGAAGADGADGSDGADGIFSAIASQAEAQAGVDNTKGMTPLRTKEAIAAQVPNLTAITDIETDVSDLDSDIQELGTRVTALEAVVTDSVGRWTGSQILLNTQAAPLALEGLLYGPGGKGDSFLRDGDGTEFAEVLVYMKRTTDAGFRFSSFVMIMQYVNSVWLIGRKDTYTLNEALEVDGITFSVATDGNKVGQVSYISDTMAGADHDLVDNSVVKWLGQEIPLGV